MVGRPSKYTDDYADALDGFGADGEGVAEAIQHLGISRDTFYRWQDEHPRFSDAVKEFKARSQSWWEKQGRVATFGGMPGFNATSYIFNMKNRFHEDWKDKQEVENTHDLSDPIKELFSEVAKQGKRIGS